MKTGNTSPSRGSSVAATLPQWSPVMKTGNTPPARYRGYPITTPQWSPVMKTGNTYRYREIAEAVG